MKKLPSLLNLPTASAHNGKDSVFRSGGQTKQYPPRPRITTAKPQPPSVSAAAAKPAPSSRIREK